MKGHGPSPALLCDVGEFGFIDRLRRRFGGPVGAGETGIGDDAAVLSPGTGKIALSTDMLVEGTHFDLRYFRPEEVGWRALMANLSDLAAVGASPVCYLVSLAAPPETPLRLLEGIFRGMARAGRSSGARLMGGDTCRADRIVLSLTVMGKVSRGRPALRRGARPGDIVFVTGDPGWSHLGLLLLSSGRPEKPAGWRRKAVRAHLLPVARLEEGVAAARSGAVSAMIDVSDGILPDLRHLLAEGNLGAVMDEKAFRLSAGFREAASVLGVDPVGAFLAGGEDYELLMTVPPQRYDAFRRAARSFPARVFPVGMVTHASGVRVRRADGSWEEGSRLPQAFAHFPASATRSRSDAAADRMRASPGSPARRTRGSRRGRG